MATQAINSKQALELYNQHFPADRPKKSALTKTLQNGKGKEAQELIAARGSEGFSEEESWQIKVFKNVDFSDEEFRSLPPRTQNLVYRTANCFNKIDLVGRLNLIKKFTADAPIKSPSILSPYMDIATVKQTVGSWLKELRKQGRLLTVKEFFTSPRAVSWRKKGENLGRILGRDHFEHLIKELNLKYIKVPEKIAVITRWKTEVSIDVREYYTENLITVYSHSVQEPLPEGYDSDDDLDAVFAFRKAHPPSVDINVYAQEINRVQRTLSAEEIDELITIIAAAHFTDLNVENIVVASDGIYFIDTEFKSFSGRIEWGKMGRFKDLIPTSCETEFSQRIHAEINKEKPVQTTLSYADTSPYEVYKEILSDSLTDGTLDEKLIERVVSMREARKPARLVGVHTDRTVSFPIQDILAAKDE